ncbi:MAG: glycosyltransferase family 39 protein [Candidatus Eremiobacteraeota bacterium]|nr:glycosyltransferase family 39 protein [Candidatus Eremiobacteraeota bacterium]
MKQERIPWILAGLTLAFHLAFNSRYGFFRDELYFIICGRHPQFGYVDQPPLVPLLAATSQSFGISLFALRSVAALFAAAAVFVTCRLVIELHGKSYAQVVAATGVALAPILATFGVLVYPDMVQVWAWPLMTLYLVRLLGGASPRWWLAVGALLGLALQSKYVAVFFAAAIVFGLALTESRRILGTRWLLGGALVAAIIAFPNFLWQAQHGFPMAELLRNSQQGKNVVLDPASYLLQQLIITNPVLSIIWLSGLSWTFVRPNLRWLGIGSIALLTLMIVLHGKDYYGCAIYPALFAAGGVAIEAATKRAAFMRPLTIAVAICAGAVLVPLAVPTLSEEHFLAYIKTLQIVAPRPSEHHRQSVLPQTYADMHGWPELAATVARVYATLPPDERRVVIIKASNYGEASALNFFGPKYGLPTTISSHNQYFLWGPPSTGGDVLIDVNGDCGASLQVYRRAVRAAVFSARYVMPYEDHLPIMVCRGVNRRIEDLWPRLKDYN